MTAGFVYFAGTVYWTSSVLAVFGGMPMILAVGAMTLLAAYLAIYPAITAMVMGRLVSQGGRAALVALPAAWVATEYLRGLLFGGFPWVPLGNRQVTMLQSSDGEPKTVARPPHEPSAPGSGEVHGGPWRCSASARRARARERSVG